MFFCILLLTKGLKRYIMICFVLSESMTVPMGQRSKSVKQVENGLLLVEEQMPCMPTDIKVGKDEEGVRYVGSRSGLGTHEREAAADFILSFSKREGVWVAPTQGQIRRILDEKERALRPERPLEMYAAGMMIALGVFLVGAFIFEPILAFGVVIGLLVVLASFIITRWSSIKIMLIDGDAKGVGLRWGGRKYRTFEPISIIVGLLQLVELKLVECRGGDGERIYYPTARLVEMVMRGQAGR